MIFSFFFLFCFYLLSFPVEALVSSYFFSFQSQSSLHFLLIIHFLCTHKLIFLALATEGNVFIVLPPICKYCSNNLLKVLHRIGQRDKVQCVSNYARQNPIILIRKLRSMRVEIGCTL